MPLVGTESNRLGDVLIWEADQRYCREVFLAEGAISLGQVLKNGTSATTQKAPAAAADTSACNAVALNTAANGEKVICLVRAPALVNLSGLVFNGSANQAQKDAQVAALKTLGIVART